MSLASTVIFLDIDMILAGWAWLFVISIDFALLVKTIAFVQRYQKVCMFSDELILCLLMGFGVERLGKNK